MSTPGVFNTLGVIMSILGGYKDACGGYHEYTGDVQYTGGIP